MVELLVLVLRVEFLGVEHLFCNGLPPAHKAQTVLDFALANVSMGLGQENTFIRIHMFLLVVIGAIR